METTAPMCTTAGEETRVCAYNSAHTEKRPIAALDHDWGAWTVTTPATCVATGPETRTCSRDTSHTETRSVPALGPSCGAWAVTTPATCTTDGQETRTCIRDTSHTETRTIDALGHAWVDWTVTIPATSTTAGEEIRICANDPSHTETREIPATGGGTTPPPPPPPGGGGIVVIGGDEEDEETIEDDDTPLRGVISFAPFIKGFPDKTFKGSNNTSREQFVIILFRILNPEELPEADPNTKSFIDVAATRWSYDAIEWALEEGIIEVGEDGRFRPAEMITRAEMAVMLAKAIGLTEKAENRFSDLDEHPDLDYILIAVNAGIFEGYPDGSFKPDALINRYELVAALVRYLLGGEPTDEMWEDIEVTLTDVPRTHWAYKYFALATTGYTALPE